eukprot:CAMPEP_0206142420 /NCGR_PEP_ID=MMETSP1473-20131121/16788_1 /ASSEMBLY_ACC=CAM_ASM_001109 /TAXON_ID=1461547 /ORGANISM="Stichococcus sp, Strain RCC1054" /LENGTH=297 /DNA_ID=CAMNT_0053537415 /DNA_START=113 /DNA_END=1006 /DNA_ORIENTATION=-
MSLAIVAACAAVVLSAATPITAYDTGSWINGRATFFGRDAWSLHEGSCGFGFVCPRRWSSELAHGYDLTAISDQNPLFKGHRGSQCGQCLEVSCRNAVVTDRYGERMDRTGTCKSESTSVKVKITDTCDCSYGPNSQSNSRWCCGDQPHLDMSQWALDKLVDDSNKWGVFAIKYRTVDCKATLSNPAPYIPIVPDPHAGQNPGINCANVGGSSTTESSSIARAQLRRPTPRPTKHSRKYWARRRAYNKAKKMYKKPVVIMKRIAAYYAQFDKNLKKNSNFKGLKNPFTLGRRLLTSQ